MVRLLEGGCRVTSLRAGQPSQRDGLRVFRHFGREQGASAISLRVLEHAPGRGAPRANAACDEVLYVLEGAGTVWLDGRPEAVEPETGFYLAPGVCLEVSNPGPTPLLMLSARCPDPGVDEACEPHEAGPRTGAPVQSPFVRLRERAAEVNGDRWYRVLVDERAGSKEVTQFVGSIPPGRAPDHFHLYEEVLCILAGQGRMWAGATCAEIGPGSCIFLPRRQVHCVENTGTGELRLLGVFYPAGSPAVRYDPESDAPDTARNAAP